MKLIPNAISRKVVRQGLLVSKHSPTILFGSGVVGMVGSTVLACRATLRLETVVGKISSDLWVARQIDSNEYSETDRKKDTAIIYVRGIKDVSKLYAPSVLLGAASIGCLTKSHNQLVERNIAVTAAYAAVDEAFKKYRGRVVEKYGEDEDRQLHYESQTIDVVDKETGEITSSVQLASDDHSMYARFFDEYSPNWNKEPEYNLLFLRTQQNWFNDLLKARGHVFLNEVYEGLGLDHTTAGSVVGWVVEKGVKAGDNFIDFGIWDNTEESRNFVNGREGSILLDFNVDGIIYDKIDDHKRGVFPWQRR